MKCRICQSELPVGAMFCGECGSSTTATPLTRKRPDPRPSDTTIILPLPPAFISVPVEVPVPTPTFDVPASEAPLPGAQVPAAPVPGVEVAGVPVQDVQVPDVPAATPAVVPVASGPAGETFVLQFSTGETVSVTGSGLIGRRPLPQPTEYFDHLIQVADVGMSVSKSHLEFGQHDGELWVSDRFSGNGTVVCRSDGTSLRCEPGRRYLVPRGSRVEIADQFFVVT